MRRWLCWRSPLGGVHMFGSRLAWLRSHDPAMRPLVVVLYRRRIWPLRRRG